MNQQAAAFERLHDLWAKLNRPIRVLLVEDNVQDVELINRALGGYRIELKVALTGGEAKEWLEQGEYDIVLLDLNLCDIPGAEVLKWAKANQKTMPFVVLTGMNDSSPMIRWALDAGAECVIQKPFTSENARMILGALR